MLNPDLWRTIFLTAAAILQTIFAALYLTFPWWRSYFGRALFYNAVSLALTLDALAAARWLGRSSDDAIFIVVYALLASGVAAQALVFLRVMVTTKRSEWSAKP